MKKVLLSSVVALSVFAVAPVFANEGINGGANTPGAYDSAEAYNNQTEFESARKAEEYLNAHAAEIQAEAAQDPAVVAAKAAFDAVEGGSHRYGELQAAYQSAFSSAYNNVRNKYVQQFQNTYNSAAKAEGNYYILNETPEQKNARYEAEHGVKPGANTQNPASKEEAAKSEAKAKAGQKAKAGEKAADKALPKTSAVK